MDIQPGQKSAFSDLPGSQLAPSSRENDGSEWAERCAHWAELASNSKPQARQKRENRPLLILSGHGVRLYVENGALIVQNGFTHYPQQREEWRFFSGKWRVPWRIVVLDGKGGLTFDALRWLSERDIQLVHIDWRGNVVHVVGGSGCAIDRNLSNAQLEATKNGIGLELSRQLITEKINNARDTLRVVFPPSPAIERAMQKLKREADEMSRHPPSTISGILGIEGRAGFAYFNAWRSFPLRWKKTGRRPIPEDWRRIGQRSSYASGRHRPNRDATHPVNAMLNYAYGILETKVRMHIVGAGLDPTIGFLHGTYRGKTALVYDLMEPLRPLFDRKVLQFVQRNTFATSDFLLTTEGVCRLSPQLARYLVQVVEPSIDLGPTLTNLSSALAQKPAR